MSAKHLIATIATVAFTIATTALTATTAFAETPDDAVATSTGAAAQATAGAVVANAKVEQSQGLTRAQVIAQTLDARKKGLIPETEADFDVAQTKKHFAK